MLYLWLKALHVAAAITFAGGVLATALVLPIPGPVPGSIEASSPTSRHLERLRAWQGRVTTPAMLAVWALGLMLAREGGWFVQAWLQAKLVLVLALSALHGVQSGVLRRLTGGSAVAPARWSGPLPVVTLLAGIAILAVMKPG